MSSSPMVLSLPSVDSQSFGEDSTIHELGKREYSRLRIHDVTTKLHEGGTTVRVMEGGKWTEKSDPVAFELGKHGASSPAATTTGMKPQADPKAPSHHGHKSMAPRVVGGVKRLKNFKALQTPKGRTTRLLPSKEHTAAAAEAAERQSQPPSAVPALTATRLVSAPVVIPTPGATAAPHLAGARAEMPLGEQRDLFEEATAAIEEPPPRKGASQPGDHDAAHSAERGTSYAQAKALDSNSRQQRSRKRPTAVVIAGAGGHPSAADSSALGDRKFALPTSLPLRRPTSRQQLRIDSRGGSSSISGGSGGSGGGGGGSSPGAARGFAPWSSAASSSGVWQLSFSGASLRSPDMESIKTHELPDSPVHASLERGSKASLKTLVPSLSLAPSLDPIDRAQDGSISGPPPNLSLAKAPLAEAPPSGASRQPGAAPAGAPGGEEASWDELERVFPGEVGGTQAAATGGRSGEQRGQSGHHSLSLDKMSVSMPDSPGKPPSNNRPNLRVHMIDDAPCSSGLVEAFEQIGLKGHLGNPSFHTLPDPERTKTPKVEIAPPLPSRPRLVAKRLSSRRNTRTEELAEPGRARKGLVGSTEGGPSVDGSLGGGSLQSPQSQDLPVGFFLTEGLAESTLHSRRPPVTQINAKKEAVAAANRHLMASYRRSVDSDGRSTSWQAELTVLTNGSGGFVLRAPSFSRPARHLCMLEGALGCGAGGRALWIKGAEEPHHPIRLNQDARDAAPKLFISETYARELKWENNLREPEARLPGRIPGRAAGH